MTSLNRGRPNRPPLVGTSRYSTAGRPSATNSARSPPSASLANSTSIRSRDMTSLHNFARHQEVVPVRDRHDFRSADLLALVWSRVVANYGILRRNLDER